jgi:hypothetical protein
VVQTPYQHRRLHVEIAAAKTAAPRAELPVEVTVKDHRGDPVAAQVALYAVDEAVLSLTNYEVPDLLPRFLPYRGAEYSRSEDLHSLLFPFTSSGTDPWFDGWGRGYGHGTGSLAGRSASSPKLMMGAAESLARSRFETTPLFLADLPTGKDGRLVAALKLPDNLTTFRIVAVASARLQDGESPLRFGVGDAKLRVSQPLVVRAALPRLLRPGDRAELAALLDNLSAPAGQVRVSLKLAGGALRLLSPDHALLPLSVGGSLRVPFTVVATAPGATEVELTAELKGAAGEVARDALRLPLEVKTEPTQLERVAVYGTLDDNRPIAVPLAVPADAQPGEGALSLRLGSTLLGELGGAVSALIDYPYGCLEQTSSRLLPLVALSRRASPAS